MDKIINVGIIGFGLSGRVFHAPIIKNLLGYNLKKIFTRNKEAKKTANELYNETEVVEDLEEIFNDTEIDLVVVATPNTSHLELTKKALLSGKHVVVEKPFTITSQDADVLIAISKEQNKKLTVYQNRRLDSDFLTVKRIIEEGLLGNLVEYEAHFDRFKNTLKKNAWREEDLPGSGMLYDLGSHLIDQALILFGLPIEIFADIRTQREGCSVDDNFEIILNYNKLKVTLKSGMLVKHQPPHFILLGDKGSFVKYGMDVQEEALKSEIIPDNGMDDWGKEPKELWGLIDTEINDIKIKGEVESEVGDYRRFYSDLYKSIIQDLPCQVAPEEARNTIRIIELAIKSSNRKRVIKYSR